MFTMIETLKHYPSQIYAVFPVQLSYHTLILFESMISIVLQWVFTRSFCHVDSKELQDYKSVVHTTFVLDLCVIYLFIFLSFLLLSELLVKKK